MSDLVEKVAEAINSYDPCLVEARAALAVVLQAVEVEEIKRNYDEDHRISRCLARENGIELDARSDRPKTQD